MATDLNNFGVQSYCFRNFKDNAEVAKMVKEIGVSSIEVCGVHADFHDVAAWKDIVKTYNDAGVDIVSIGVQTFTGDDKERDWFECAAAAGAKHISAHWTVDTFTSVVPKTAKLCEEFGIKIGTHCHGGYMFGGDLPTLKYICELGGPMIGVNIDTAWCMQTFRNPVDWVGELGSSVHGVHYKDFTFGRDAKWTDVVVGTGNLDLPAFIDALKKVDFDGMAVIEYEADVEAPVPALTKCVNEMRKQLA